MKKKRRGEERRRREGVVSGMENEMDIPSVCALRPARHVRREEEKKGKKINLSTMRHTGLTVL